LILPLKTFSDLMNSPIIKADFFIKLSFSCLEAAPCSLAYGQIPAGGKGAGHSFLGATFRGSRKASLTLSDRRTHRGRHKSERMEIAAQMRQERP
jgi:hypothetical protein